MFFVSCAKVADTSQENQNLDPQNIDTVNGLDPTQEESQYTDDWVRIYPPIPPVEETIVVPQ